MDDKNKKKEALKDSSGGEILGAIIFTIVMGVLMWLASKFLL